MINVVEFAGSNDDLVWKSPIVDFDTLTQVNVNESHEAVLYRDGKAYDRLVPGKHVLDTENIPMLSKLLHLGSREKTPFRCEVYFINRVEHMAIKWGAHSVNYLDAHYNNYAFPLSAYGELSLRVEDSRKLLIKVVGTQELLKLSTMRDNINSIIVSNVCSQLPSILTRKNVDVYEVDRYLKEVGQEIQSSIAAELSDYGIALERFLVEEIVRPEKDPVYRQIMELRGKAATIESEGALDIRKTQIGVQKGLIQHEGETQKRIMDIEARSHENMLLGISEKERLQLDVAKHIADNPGSGSDTQNAMMGLAVGMATMKATSEMMGTCVNEALTGTKNEDVSSRVSEELMLNSGINSFREKMDMLKYARDVGAITEEVYAERLQKLLESNGI